MYALFLKLFDVIFEVIIYVFAKELLDDSQIAFVVDFDARLKSLERLDNLDSDPVILVFKFSNNAFFKSLETSLFEYSQHAIVPDFELEAIRIRELQLWLLLFVKTFVYQFSLLLLAWLRLLCYSVVAEAQSEQKLGEIFVSRVRMLQKLIRYCWLKVIHDTGLVR